MNGHCDGSNCQAPAAIAKLQADVHNVGREIGQLRQSQTALLEKISVVAVACERLAAETKALGGIEREEIKTLFALDKERAAKIAAVELAQSKLVSDEEHDELAEKVDGMDSKITKIMVMTAAVTAVATAVLNSIVTQAVKGLFQ